MDERGKPNWGHRYGIRKALEGRAELARAYGWQFAEEAPWLPERWPVIPFSQRGDMRHAYGVMTGAFQGMSFTVVDFFRRPTVIVRKELGIKVSERDQYDIDTVWVFHNLPRMPFFQIARRWTYHEDNGSNPRPATGDKKFDKKFRLVDTDPYAAGQVLTPWVQAWLRDGEGDSLSLLGTDVLYTRKHMIPATKPEMILSGLQALAYLVPLLPGQAGQPPVQQYPQQPGYQQPQAYPQQAPVPYPQQAPVPQQAYQQPYPPQQYPQPAYQQPYPQQPSAQQPYPQQPYPPQGYPQQPGHPQQPYPHGYPQQQYPPQPWYPQQSGYSPPR
ncbi:hypothetical protein [Actinokineospora enzanensis]|uniref:hypothetical protein n=1 Tax=Actinokineospora enzanensis TaxID=155975 RepID=UPI0003AB39FB|nr:hypothetical protein [Actinokineospora enzanensis]